MLTMIRTGTGLKRRTVVGEDENDPILG